MADDTKDTATKTKGGVEYEGYTLIHKGFGKYSVEGQGDKVFNTKAEAQGYVDDLLKVAAFENEFGDVVPEGVQINSRPLQFRRTMLELPMNEHYTPDGDPNPYYDRAWYWGWGRAQGDDIAKKQSRGWRVVSREELEQAVEDDSVPEHYRQLLMPVDTGTRMQYGDLVLMRQPRVLWRQQQAAKEEAARRRIYRTDEEQQKLFDDAGVRTANGPITNEIRSGLKVDGI